MPKKKVVKMPPLKKGGWFVRKRDKTVVYIDQVGRVNVRYVTMPLLLVYPISVANFCKNFRPATIEEIAPHKEYLV
jgi:hypothetical protein